MVNAVPGSIAVTGLDADTTYEIALIFNSTVTAPTSIVLSGGVANRTYELPLRGVG
jgi:hypothetical protein